jgi:biopolymer transport protein ExbB
MEFNIVDKLLSMTLLGSEWVLWLLIILSVVSVGIMIERIFYFRQLRIDFAAFSRDLDVHLGKGDLQAARKLCQASPALESQVALRGIEGQEKGTTKLEELMTAFLIRERQTLDRGIIWLGTLGNNAPFIGLFGTVLGIIIAFHDLAKNPAGGPSVVMAGISEALVATAVGLLVAIPAVIAFNYFQKIVKRHVANAESVMQLVLAYGRK